MKFATAAFGLLGVGLVAVGVMLLGSLALAGALSTVTDVAPAAVAATPAVAAPARVAPPRVTPARTAEMATVIAFARSQLGAPYRWGGAGPLTWDCSGLVMVAYASVGIGLPHNAEEQYEATAGATVAVDALQPGDLVFFGPDRAAIGHVGIAIGDGLMIDAPHTGATVRVESLHWPDLLVATRPMSAVATART